ncbi:riboflavin synthase [Arenibaculum sp.]|jgi:riboflavin synthase|uniref:riboflavin synthase n=1 Tax=Arenibaculum sp. TaxID=2865862 RepID=UPI002E0EA519|nr:riboflavin synthase [Arenibaculum sp.]
MFTGIVTDVGRIAEVERRGDTVFTIETRQDLSDVRIGASIACSGICLTAVSTAAAERGGRFVVSASAETLSKSTAGAWTEGTEINLERALRLGDELGGHVVSGHVDGLAELIEVRPEGDSHRLLFEVPAELAQFVAPKGSVTLDGVSLTVNEVDGAIFGVNVIPHTWDCTTLGRRRPGDRLNFEADMLARYVARLLAVRGS